MILYDRHIHGDSVQDLAAGLGIPEERVRKRLQAAQEFAERRKMQDGLFALGARVDEANRKKR